MRKIPYVKSHNKAVCLTLLCFFVYAVSYIGRLNYAGVMAEMIDDSFITKVQGGTIATAYFLCYGIGQFINGFAADKVSPGKLIVTGLLGAAIANWLMGIAGSYTQMILIWAINGYFQSLIWGPVFILVTQSIPENFKRKSILLLNSSSAAGAALSYAFTGLILKYVSWRKSFILSAGCLGATLAIWIIVSALLFHNADQVPNIENSQKANSISGKSSYRKTLYNCFIGSGLVFIILPAMIHGMLKDGITSWLPTYITETFTLSAHLSVLVSTVVPLFNILGAVMAYLFMKKFNDEFVSIVAFFLMAFTSLTALCLFGTSSIFFTILLFAIVTASMMGVNAILCSNIPTQFVKYGISATISGFFNACGYLGTAVSMYFIAQVSQSFGWNTAIIIWISSCVVAIVLTVLGIGKWRTLVHNQDKTQKMSQIWTSHKK